MKILCKYIFGLLLLCSQANAQHIISQDSLHVLTLDEFTYLLGKYHPVASQADLIADRGYKNIRRARGRFDPIAYVDFDQKNYADKQYFSIFDAGLAFPTWLGTTFFIRYFKTSGVFLNPENFTPTGGFMSVGADVTLGRGLLMDKRRTTLRQAQIFRKSSEAQKISRLNDLYFEAITQYWNWVKAYQQYITAENFVDLSLERFNALKKSYYLGLEPAIDTLAAVIQYQEFQVVRNEARLQFQKEGYKLSNFLWYENQVPINLTERVVPPDTMIVEDELPVSQDSVDNILVNLNYTHPDLITTRYTLDSLAYTRRLRTEYLKPTLDVGYRMLFQPVKAELRDSEDLIDFTDFRVTARFAYPLFIRQARGELQLTKIKIAKTRYGYDQKQLELTNKVRNYYAQITTLNKQVQLYTQTVSNYDRLLWGETRRFEVGESSIFLVNQRAQQYQNAFFKLIDLKAKYHIAEAGLVWSSGQLFYLYESPAFE